VTEQTRWDELLAGVIKIPANDTLGFEMVPTDDPKQEIALSWTVPAEFCNSVGSLQGGVMAAFADALLGVAAAGHLPDNLFPALADMHISIMRPAPAGMALTGRGRILKAGRRVLFAEAEIFDDDGRLIAKATGTEIPATS
jgi:uncharacterized protein (TIGR00369 family)